MKDDTINILRKKLLGLEGFANALKRSRRSWLLNWITDARSLLNSLTNEDNDNRWHTIHELPPSGRVLLYDAHTKYHIGVGHYIHSVDGWSCGDGESVTPTHWRYLPEAPPMT